MSLCLQQVMRVALRDVYEMCSQENIPSVAYTHCGMLNIRCVSWRKVDLVWVFAMCLVDNGTYIAETQYGV